MSVAMSASRPELRHRAAPHARSRRQPELAAGRRLEQGDLQHGAAGDRAGAAADRGHRAPDPRQHDRGAASNFVRTRAPRACPPRITVTRHALQGRLLPVVSYLGPGTADIITGSLVVEQIFGIPGSAATSCRARSTATTRWCMGVVIFYGALIILLNLIVDLLYGLLDPKVRYDVGEAEAWPAPHPPGAAAEEAVKGRSLWADARRRLLRNSAAVVSLVLLASSCHRLRRRALVPIRSDDIDWSAHLGRRRATRGHWFGTDANGRDLFAASCYGGRLAAGRGGRDHVSAS